MNNSPLKWHAFIFADVWSGPRYLEYLGVGLTSVVYVTWPCPRRAWFLSDWPQGSNPGPYTAFQKKKELSDCLNSLSYGYSKASYIRQTLQLSETACFRDTYKATSIYFRVVVVFRYLTYFTLWILIAWIKISGENHQMNRVFPYDSLLRTFITSHLSLLRKQCILPQIILITIP